MPAAAFVSYDDSTMTYTVDESLVTLPSDIGLHTFTIYIDSVEYAASVAQVTRTFNVNIVCTVTGFIFTSVPKDMEHVMKTNTKISLPFTFTQQDLCNLPVQITHSAVLNGTPQGSLPPCINFDPLTSQYSVNCAAKGEVGFWDIKTEVTATHPDGTLTSDSSTFTLEVIDDCKVSYLINREFEDMSSVISGTPAIQDIFVPDYVSTYKY